MVQRNFCVRHRYEWWRACGKNWFGQERTLKCHFPKYVGATGWLHRRDTSTANVPWETGAVAPAIRSLCSPKPLTRAFLPAVTCLPGTAELCDPSPVSCGKRGCGGTGDLAVRAFSQQTAERSYPPPAKSGGEQARSRHAGLGAGGASPVRAQQRPSEPHISVLPQTALRRPSRKGLHNRQEQTGVNPPHHPASWNLMTSWMQVKAEFGF